MQLTVKRKNISIILNDRLYFTLTVVMLLKCENNLYVYIQQMTINIRGHAKCMKKSSIIISRARAINHRRINGTPNYSTALSYTLLPLYILAVSQ